MNAAASAIFSVSLGMLGVGIPLLALHAGYNAAQVGLLVALSAIAQLVTRSVMGMMMRKLPEKIFAIVAALLIALSCGLIAASLSLLAGSSPPRWHRGWPARASSRRPTPTRFACPTIPCVQ
jgi:MFS family permease